MDSLEPRRLMAAQAPLAINFNDEALWDTNFPVAVAQAKALGVKAVRLWFGFDGYDTRPNAWDPVSPFGAVSAGEIAPEDAWLDGMPTVMTRAFQLKQMGFTVLGVLQRDDGSAPATQSQARGFVRYLMDCTQLPGSTERLKDVIDYWEIGNEPDSSSYWKPSASGKTAGLKSYVDNWLIPAAAELHANGDDENVVSAGVSYSPADLKTVIDEVSAKGAWSTVDYLGFHPYGVVNSATNDIAKNTAAAAGYAKAVGRPLIATEWNVRGFGNYGANDATWAATMDSVYRNTILPNYEMAFYFTLVNNWAGRGGTTSARPGGLLKHASPIAVTPGSPILDLRTYFNSPLVVAEPFYSTFKKWGMGSVAGTVSTQTAGQSVSGLTVFVDVDGDGAPEAGEPTAVTNGSGAYTLYYDPASVPAGTYVVQLVTPANAVAVVGGVGVPLDGTAAAGVNFVIKSNVAANTASISGYLWNDSNGDGLFNTTDSYTGSRAVYLDANRNGKLDSGEKGTTSDANGNYAFTGLAAGTYYVTRVFPSGYKMSNGPLGYLTVVVAAGQAATGINIGTTYKTTTTPPPPTPPTTPEAPVRAGSFSGTIWGDTNGDGVRTPDEDQTGARVVFIDANANGKLDAGEKQTTSATNGVYTFTGLVPGTYNVTRVFPTGFRLSNGTNGGKFVSITLAAGQSLTGVDLGSVKA